MRINNQTVSAGSPFRDPAARPQGPETETPWGHGGEMRIGKITLIGFVVLLLWLIMPTSCSKTGYTITQTTADSATQIINGNDEMNINYEVDQAVNEALLATSLSKIASGNTASIGTGPVLYTTLSNVIIDTTEINDSALIRLTYYGKNADQTKGRTGNLNLTFARDTGGKIIPWGTPGASININFSQYEVIVIATNVSIWMNGNITVTNTSGGLLKKTANISLQPGDSLQDKLDGNIIFTYNDNVSNIVTWTWYITQTRVFNLQNAVLTSTIRGDSSINGNTGISTSGTTRFGYVFNTQITSPVVQSISASYLLSNPLSGEKSIRGIQEPLTIDYGVNSNGTPAQTSTPYGYKMTWVHSGGQAVTIVPY